MIKLRFFTILLIHLVLLNQAVYAYESVNDSLESIVNQETIADTARLKIMMKLSKEYTFNSPEKALVMIEKAMQLAQKLKNQKSEADALSLKGKVLKNNGEYPQAIAVHLKSLKIKEQIKDTIGQSISNNDIGVVYKSMKNFRVAMSYYRRSNYFANLANFGKGIANTLNNIGTSFFELHQLDSAIYYYNKALSKSLEIQDPGCLSTSYNNLGNIYGYNDKPELALQYYLKCLENDKQVNDSYGITLSLLNIGESYKQMKLYDKSLSYLLQAKNICLENDAKPLLKDSYRSIADCYQNMHRYDSAYKYIERYSLLKDSLLSEESTQQIAEMQTRFETEKKDLQIAKQNAELQVSKSDAQRKNTINYLLLASVLLILIFSYLFYNRYKLKQQSILDAELLREREIRSKAIIEAEENERRRIAQDLHDGVGQLLSASKLNLSNLSERLQGSDSATQTALKNAMDLLDDSVKEIRTVSHNMMPNALLKSGLVAAVREFVQKLGNAERLKIDLEVTGLSERLDPTVEAILFRVLQEIVSNIVKHAQASVISIQLIKHEQELTVMVEDNGVGFDASNLMAFNGIGLKNIQSRVAYLNGQVNFDSLPGKGTTVVIEIPI